MTYGMSNLPQYRRANSFEEEWFRRRNTSVIEADRLIHSRMIDVQAVEDLPFGPMFLDTMPPVIRFEGRDYIPAVAYDRFQASAERVIRDAVDRRWARLRKPGGGPNRGPSYRVYFVRSVDTGDIKIGTSKSPRLRLQGLQSGSPSRLTLVADMPGDIETERELHERFKSARHKGEWFKPVPELLEFIASIGGQP